jgi:DNA-binding XRE family transcriptional regulator
MESVTVTNFNNVKAEAKLRELGYLWIAEKLGVSEKSVADIFAGKALPEQWMVAQIAGNLRTSISALLIVETEVEP